MASRKNKGAYPWLLSARAKEAIKIYLDECANNPHLKHQSKLFHMNALIYHARKERGPQQHKEVHHEPAP